MLLQSKVCTEVKFLTVQSAKTAAVNIKALLSLVKIDVKPKTKIQLEIDVL